ncbi:MAG TPA: hypothetical protein VLV89_05040 [Candidatus Acidoferrum sp.]|nr:hypothetical protein [Candidatus Acidoferrum sp.]
MKTKLLLSLASFLILATAFVLVRPSIAQRGGGSHGAPPAHSAPPARSSAPRANQGRVPPPPAARTNPGEQRQTEHLPTGHVNDTPHVNHGQWYGHEAPNDPRFRLDRPFEHGRFQHFGPGYRYGFFRVDANLHRFWFPGGYFFDVAAWDWPLFSDWCWDCGEDYVVYEDLDHPGWYILYNVYTGAYVHVQYMGGM